jgi:hypothetical protein
MQEKELEIKVLNEVDKFHEKTGGKCGISANQIAFNLNLPFLEIKKSLNNLYDRKAFRIKNGINHILIFKNNI